MTNNTVKNIKMPDGQVLNIGGADTVPLFTGQYFDFKPNNVSWLKSGEQANSGGIYTTAYDTLVNCLTEDNNIYDLKVIEESEMEAGVDYSEFWKVNQDEMYFVTPTTISKKVYKDTANVTYIKNTDNFQTAVLQDGSKAFTAIVDVGVDSNSRLYKYSTSGSQFNIDPNGTLAVDLEQSDTAKLYFKVANAVENLELLNAGEVLEALADKIGRQECKAYITETYQNGSSWYRVYSDGWCEQGGRCPSSGSITVTLLKAYSNTNYQVIFSYVNSNETTGNVRDNSIISQSTNKFITSNMQRSGNTNWYACGYIN